MKVKEIMYEAVVVDPGMSVYEIVRLMSRKDTGSVLVKHGTTTGILTETDVLRITN